MKRFWFEFDFEKNAQPPPGTQIGCGITAFSYEQAIEFLKARVFKSSHLPQIKRVIEDVKIPDLDQGHVIPNMTPPNLLGVWFPLGYNP